MRLIKSNHLINIVNGILVDSPQPTNLSYIWNFGSLLVVSLLTQIITGIILAMHYVATSDIAFISVEIIIREVSYGWLLRYIHANIASLFFVFVYFHIGRGIYYGSYRSPRSLTWSIGTLILILILGIAFLGYVLPYGQISIWAAVVITNLIGVIPLFGQKLVNLIIGNFTVESATVNRFFALHYLLPFVLSALALLHILSLHVHGSSNPLGVNGLDRVGLSPYFLFKDLVTISSAFWLLFILVSYYPNVLSHSDNYIIANPIVTPASIVPEWYILPYYAILRSIPNKSLGVLAILISLLILLALPILDKNYVRGNRFAPIKRFIFWIFVINFLLLMWLGSKHVEYPYVLIGQLCTVFYFSWFILLLPICGILENSLVKISYDKNNK